jgi:glycogen debranching enzyme
MQFGPDICTNPDEAVKHEWLETNGLGGFASSTIIGLNTRRYHGLLTAATKPPVGRVLLLSKLEETLIVNGQRFPLSANRYPGVIHPQGFQYLVDFRLDPFPTFTYRAGGVELIKRVFMVQGENTTVIEYDIPADCQLELQPLIAFRDYHGTTHENAALNRTVQTTATRATVQPYPDLPPLHLTHNASTIDTSHQDWFRNFEFTEEQARGLDFREDLFNPFTLTFTANKARVVASTVEHQPPLPPRATFKTTLEKAADQFIVKRGEFKTIIAGYHWFSDWGRDTMIALPGLTLTTGRYQIAKDILKAFAACISEGMLPNRFPDAGETPEYNTVDATLWFFEAIRAYLEKTNDPAFAEELTPKLEDIIAWHIKGTRYGIGVDPEDGLLHCGQPGVQLTWMDAKVGGWVVTPREGKPVEIQALWYNALRILQDLTKNPKYAEMAAKARDSFNAKFWNAEAQCLLDTDTDAAIRPNQIFAVSLPHSMLPKDKARAVVEKVKQELLTPMGLRTLARTDPDYRGTYAGGPRDRDGAYHQGTVWPWLIGPFLRARRRTHPEDTTNYLQPLLDYAEANGQLPEIADGDWPHTARGCIAQAWSVAEVLGSLME